MFNILKKIIGNSNEDEVKNLYKIVEKINSLESFYEKLSDDELKEQTNILKEKYKSRNSLDLILEEAFGVVREASKRCLGCVTLMFN